MDPKTAVFWPLDPGRTLLSTLVIHVLLRARTRSLALLKTCPKYVVQTGFRNLPIGAHPHNGSIRACDHVETPLATGEIGGPKNRKRGLQRDCRRCIVDGSVQFSKEMWMAVAANIHMAIGLRTAHRR